MKRACAGLVGSAVLTATLAVTPSANAYDPGTSADFFGVNGAVLRNFVNPDKAATLEGLATSMGGQGISWTRITFDQAVDEKEKGVFNWYAEDQMVAALARHGVRGAASFVGTATWAADPAMYGTCPWGRAYPHDLDGWTTWVAAAARRYGSTGGFWILHPELPKLPIRTWEIGNEVNSAAFWCPGANPEQYAQVYSASSDAIKAVDPTAKVIVAGLAARFGPQSGGNLDVDSFLSRMTAADPSLRTRIDAVGIHPYAGTVDGALYRVSLYRQAMAAAGMPSTPMLANEIGWSTQGPDGLLKATEEQRAGLHRLRRLGPRTVLLDHDGAEHRQRGGLVRAGGCGERRAPSQRRRLWRPDPAGAGPGRPATDDRSAEDLSPGSNAHRAERGRRNGDELTDRDQLRNQLHRGGRRRRAGDADRNLGCRVRVSRLEWLRLGERQPVHGQADERPDGAPDLRRSLDPHGAKDRIGNCDQLAGRDQLRG
jgi:hypothetical protein